MSDVQEAIHRVKMTMAMMRGFREPGNADWALTKDMTVIIAELARLKAENAELREYRDEFLKGHIKKVASLEAEAADWRAYGNRWAENYTVLEAEIEELNAELQKRERWMKDNRAWDDYCGGVVPSGPPRPSEDKP